MWYHKWSNCVNPGPIDMTGFTCHHGIVHVTANDGMKLMPVPASVWDTLQVKYKGGPR